MTTTKSFKSQINEEFSNFLRNARRAKLTSRENTLCYQVACDASEQYRKYNAATVKLYEKVKTDLTILISDIYNLVYDDKSDAATKNTRRNLLQKRLQGIYDDFKCHEWYTNKRVTEIKDIYDIGIEQPSKLFSNFLAKKIKLKFDEYATESRSLRRILKNTFTCISRELDLAVINVPKQNSMLFSITQMVHEEDKKER